LKNEAIKTLENSLSGETPNVVELEDVPATMSRAFDTKGGTEV
jgi:hypothetical protein